MRAIICLIATAIFGLTALSAQQVEVVFDYEKQDGRGSNQFAVYIENPEGEIVRTLYVTHFTARGGYESRPSSLPRWVAKSGIGKADIASGATSDAASGDTAATVMAVDGPDAYSGATPGEGTLRYVWDLKDHKGKRVKEGTYYCVVEGTYLGDNQVLFREALTTGGEESTIKAQPQFNSQEPKNRTMISSVRFRYIP